jgi:sporulation protein YlmC with PRC-barrel domain
MRDGAQEFAFTIQEEDMLKKHIAACLVATAFIAAPALAQTSGQSGSASSGSAASSASSGQFMTHMQPSQWRGSKLMGVDIYGSNNEKIGDVKDVLLDKSGKSEAVVIGVGGFLGIGEKDVAVPFSAIQWKDDRSDLSTASTTRAPTTGTGGLATNPNAPATTGTTGTTGTTAGTARDMDRGYPDHGVLSMTKDQLKDAPSFRYSMTDASTAPARTTAPASSTAPATAPKQ